MIFAYSMRLACLSLAVMFLVNFTASALVLSLLRQVVCAAQTMQPLRAARMFLALRMLPSVLSLGAVFVLCIPSYLRFEENSGVEKIGFFCLVMAALGLVLCVTTAYRTSRTCVQLFRIEQRCRWLRRVQSSTSSETPLCVTAEDEPGMPLLALVGIMHPTRIVSRRLLDTLSAEQIEAALSHEDAHEMSRDNLKRLLFALAPGILPFVSGFAGIEQHWERYSELAADDYAASGRPDRSVALAEALIQVARLDNRECGFRFSSSLSVRNLDLAMRVDRLLAVHPVERREDANSNVSWKFCVATAAILAALVLPKLLTSLYPLLESLLH
jgi:Zn-dependent protease with chaperone function